MMLTNGDKLFLGVWFGMDLIQFADTIVGWFS